MLRSDYHIPSFISQHYTSQDFYFSHSIYWPSKYNFTYKGRVPYLPRNISLLDFNIELSSLVFLVSGASYEASYKASFESEASNEAPLTRKTRLKILISLWEDETGLGIYSWIYTITYLFNETKDFNFYHF